ncbi:hypothetical protein KIW84_035785 [Lathyrus oleraceus]|uniref:Uncharacterized protein n=1 Tax=Pisum sativum TaxID=3888 RepID=A0A9D4Y709_PEA|nr:hypothetical protein KIW84_035785 [Pisum sativum]
MWEPDSDNDSSVALEHVKSAGIMQVREEGSGMNGVAAMRNFGATWFDRPFSSPPPVAELKHYKPPLERIGGIPESSNLPNKLLSLVLVLSPSKTWIKTSGWLSE